MSGQGSDGGDRRGDRRGGGRRRPAGIERAERAEGTLPPRSPRRRQPVAKPDIPDAIRSDVPGSVWRELKATARAPQEVAKALTIAGDALADGDVERALTYLRWAKREAGRAPGVREALGIALYHAEDYAGALSELQAYRRLSARTDQNHLIADCLRATGRSPAKVGEVVADMDPDEDGMDRFAEGVIVWASALADGGDVDGGRTVLGRLLEELDDDAPPAEHTVRLWYVAGDLADRAGDEEDARRWFARIAELDEELFDVEQRLAGLGG